MMTIAGTTSRARGRGKPRLLGASGVTAARSVINLPDDDRANCLLARLSA
jgi:hypothetical protein